MLKDAQNLVVTTDSPQTVAAIDQFIDQSLCYGKAAEAMILEAIAADPDCAIAQAYAAAYYLSQENATGRQQAQPYLKTAQQQMVKASQREQLYIRAIAAWNRREMDQAIALHEAIAHHFPQDLLSVQQGQYHYFYQGNQARLLQIAQTVLPENQQNPYLHGMIAFGLEQCHQLQAAEIWGRRATEINRNNPWAHHAVAHVMETQGRVDEGIAWMESFADTWENCNSMLYTHNWWHVALYYLAKGNAQAVLNLYDQQVWGRARKDSPKDQVGAIALLLRLELLGVEVGETRWQSLGLYLLSRIHEHALPFQDLHYVYALARSGRLGWLKEMLLSMEAYAHMQPGRRSPWIEVALPAAQGMVAHAKGNWRETIASFQPILPKLGVIGGSHAQRNLFNQIYLNALERHSEVNLRKQSIPLSVNHSSHQFLVSSNRSRPRLARLVDSNPSCV
jgi:tetratricopeptide (TPR) repeat protein